MNPEVDIRDIRAPILIPPWWHWPLAIAVAALLALAVVVALRAWQKRREARRTPLERARRALLAAEVEARKGRAKAWADIVAETLRAALARRLGADVLPRTTTELATMTQSAEADAVIELLEICDLARFALATVDADALVSHTELARALVTKLYAPEAKPSPTQLNQSTVRT